MCTRDKRQEGAGDGHECWGSISPEHHVEEGAHAGKQKGDSKGSHSLKERYAARDRNQRINIRARGRGRRGYLSEN